MAYEVIKQRGKRAYRYTVEYYHDDSGKGKTRWQYQGPVHSTPALTADGETRPTDRVSTASRLLDALERLLVRGEYADVTASAIALEAQVAHGTFYRHFKDKRDALRAAMMRMGERAEHLATLETPTPSQDTERRRVRDWLRQKLATVGEQPGVWRAWCALSESDPTVAEIRLTIKANYRNMLSNYLQQLRDFHLTNLEDTQSSARSIMALLAGLLQDAFMQGNRAASPGVIDQACVMIDRMIFSTDLGAIPPSPSDPPEYAA